MKASPWILPLVMAVLLGGIHVLPRAGDVAQSAVSMTLPERSAGWWLKPHSPSSDELNTLPPDTQFSKAICLRPRLGEMDISGRSVPDRIDVSIVLSGSDLNSSIHRPERCMPAQGHAITASGDVQIHAPNGYAFRAKRLRSIQSVMMQDQAKPTKFHCLTYYFFVGHHQITNDHLSRTFADIRDRLFRGMDQRWAYVSASMWYGKVPWLDHEITEADADATLSEFVSGFAQTQLNWPQLK